jgi:hypothetical protein
VEICGQPVVELELESDQEVAMVAVRLIDVAEDYKATRVSYGVLNLTHRDSDEFPEALEPGRRYRVRVPMKHIAQRFPKGHSIRLSISTSYWPVCWPAPKPARLKVYLADSRLLLPHRPPRPEDEALPAFEPPEGAPPLAKTLIEPKREGWTVIRDLANNRTTLEVVHDEGRYRHDEIDLEIAVRTIERYAFAGDSYDSLSGWTEWERSFARGDWSVRVVTRTLLTSNEEAFRIRATLDAFENESRVYARSWDEEIPRDLV